MQYHGGTRVFDWHKRYTSSKSACMLKLRVTTTLFVFFDDRDIVYHEIDLLQVQEVVKFRTLT